MMKTTTKSDQKFCQVVWSFCLITITLLWTNQALAGPLADRIANFPNWKNKPSISAAEADLIYPDWMAGTWNVKSTLVDMVAPLAPAIVTPGFENNRSYLNHTVNFQVRFIKLGSKFLPRKTAPKKSINLPIYGDSIITNENQQKFNLPQNVVIADRQFNSLNIGKSLLGEDGILAVNLDSNNPNRQTTILPDHLKLVSVVTSRESEALSLDRFIDCEITQQIFQSDTMIYLNEVETITKYDRILTQNQGEKIAAEQITAIYLSPQDPDYFLAANRPVALYRYQLELLPVEMKNKV